MAAPEEICSLEAVQQSFFTVEQGYAFN